MTGETHVIELDNWGIDGDPTNNSNGINNALNWAAQSGYSEVVLPPGEYLIKEDIPIKIVNSSNMKINLNSAVLKINPNGLTSNKIVRIADSSNIQLVNGTVLGDINTHDYTTNPGTHEGNLGILIDGGVVNLTLDNLTVRDITGWGITTSTGKDYVGYPPVGIVNRNLRQGSIDPSNGVRISDNTKISTITPIDLTRFMNFADRYLILAYDKGYMGNPYLSTNQFDVIFYDKDKNIINVKTSQLIYKKVVIPDHTVYADFIFYQPDVPTKGDTDFNGAVLFVTHYIQPTDIKITNCTIDGARSLGIAICGGDGVTIADSTIKNTKKQAPGYGVNLEDGWEFMNEIRFINNRFENNINDFVSSAGDNMVIEGNTFTKTFYIWSRTTNYTVRNNSFNGSTVTFQTDMSKNDYTAGGNKFINAAVKGSNLSDSSFENSNFLKGNANNCTFTSNKKVALNGSIRGSKFKSLWAEGDFNIFYSEITGSNLSLTATLVNGKVAKKNIVDNSNFNKSSLNLNSNIDLNVTNSRLTDTTMGIGGGWNKNLFAALEYNVINNPNITAPFINAFNSFGSINLKRNSVVITSAQPIIKLFNPAYINGQPLVADVNIIGNNCSTSGGTAGSVIAVTFGIPTSVITLRNVSNIFINLSISDAVKNKSMIKYTTSL